MIGGKMIKGRWGSGVSIILPEIILPCGCSSVSAWLYVCYVGKRKCRLSLDNGGKCGIIPGAVQDARWGPLICPSTRGCTARLAGRAAKSPQKSASA
jgi:hypothetical protein